MLAWTPDRLGFVPAYMVAGSVAVPYHSDQHDNDATRLERRLRQQIAKHALICPPEHMHLQEISRLNTPWRAVCEPGASFVNLSDFYAQMQYVTFDLATVLIASEDCVIAARLWSWAACDLYLNGSRIGQIMAPDYKPIQYTDLRLSLHKGENSVYIACETLGVRDTRSVAGLQLLERTGDLQIILPDRKGTDRIMKAQKFLSTLSIHGSTLHASEPFPDSVYMTAIRPSPDYRTSRRQPDPVLLPEGAQSYPLPDGCPLITIEVRTASGPVRKTMERLDQILPQYGDPHLSTEANLKQILTRIAAVESLNHGDEGLPVSQVLARKALGIDTAHDLELMTQMLDAIEQRVDCADFRVMGLIRYLKVYGDNGLPRERIRDVLLNFRYWMDQQGFDGMCFWSENHSLIFYSCALFAGRMYPDATFPRAGMTGHELAQWGQDRLNEWFECFQCDGFEEFNSGVYMLVTFAALLNLIDFAGEVDPALAQSATRAADLLLERLAMHTFRGGILAPMGRIYRSVLYPYRQGSMALMNLLDPAQPWDYAEGWLAFLATSHYQLPEQAVRLLSAQIHETYTTGNALIRLDKTDDTLLTSVASPRTDGARRWPNIALDSMPYQEGHTYTRSMNERFHGTSCFEPGTHGYQQHLWYAALSGDVFLFVNHPGSTSEGGDMRPGYWHGNSIIPALTQTQDELLMIYRIPDHDPVHFVHLFCPFARADRVVEENHWLFLQKDSGMLAFWTSARMEPFDGLLAGCERRMYGDSTACVVRVSGREQGLSFEDFQADCLAHPPVWDDVHCKLHTRSAHLEWTPGHDETQCL